VAAGAEPLGLAVSPDGQSVYVANQAGDNVSQYDVGAGGGLSPKSPATVTAGSIPQGVATTRATPAARRPGKGCGDKNHVHDRQADCKKPPG
jgi:DNA-binding beta-propeller fold protein YncE